MKLKSLKLPAYPPLKNAGFNLKPGFNLIFGENEQGKSLRMDAMTKLLVGKKSKKFTDIQRVDADPAQFGGYLELETAEQKTHQLQGQDNLAELLGITADDCENIFLIRNSQLSIGQDLVAEQNFYTNFTDRLTGLKTQLIKSLEKKLRDLTNLTPTSDQLSSTTDNNKLGDRVKQAQELLSEGLLYRLLNNKKLKEWDAQIQQLVQKKTKLKTDKKTIEKMEVARKREEYEQAKKSLQTIKDNQEKLDNQFAKFTQEQLQEWHDQRTTLKHYQENLQKAEQELGELKQEKKQLQEEAQKIQQQLDLAEQKHSLIQNQFQPQIENLKNLQAEIQAQQAQQQLWTWISSAAGLVLLLSIIGIWQQPNSILNIVAAVSLIITGAGLFLLTKANQIQTQFAQKKARLKLDLEQHQLSSHDLNSMLTAVQEQAQQYAQLKNQATQASMSLQGIDSQIERQKNNELKRLDRLITEAEREINRIKLESSLQDYEQYQEKLKQKQQIKEKIKTEEAILKNRYGTAMITSRNHERWQKEIDKLAQYADQAKNHQYDEQQLQTLKSQQTSLENEITDLEKNLKKFQETLNSLGHKVRAILLDQAEDLHLQSRADLQHLAEQLQNFINQHIHKKNQALAIIDILQQIAQEDKQKIASLFGAESLISQHFQQITDQRYQLVEFDQEQSKIMVHNTQGKPIDPKKLSAGTYDQLYFAIRLGLAQKLLDGPGFFIMDDPFLKSDQGRLQKQLQMLLDLTEQGWQIIYFSAKDEVKNTLKKLGQHHLITI